MNEPNVLTQAERDEQVAKALETGDFGPYGSKPVAQPEKKVEEQPKPEDKGGEQKPPAEVKTQPQEPEPVDWKKKAEELETKLADVNKRFGDLRQHRGKEFDELKGSFEKLNGELEEMRRKQKEAELESKKPEGYDEETAKIFDYHLEKKGVTAPKENPPEDKGGQPASGKGHDDDGADPEVVAWADAMVEAMPDFPELLQKDPDFAKRVADTANEVGEKWLTNHALAFSKLVHIREELGKEREAARKANEEEAKRNAEKNTKLSDMEMPTGGAGGSSSGSSGQPDISQAREEVLTMRSGDFQKLSYGDLVRKYGKS